MWDYLSTLSRHPLKRYAWCFLPLRFPPRPQASGKSPQFPTPVFCRIEKMMRKYPREICGETASQNTPDTGITSIGGADRRFGYPPPPPPGQWGTNPDFSGGSTSASEPPGGIFA